MAAPNIVNVSSILGKTDQYALSSASQTTILNNATDAVAISENAVPPPDAALCTSTVMSQAFVPSTFATWIMFTFRTSSLDAALFKITVCDADESAYWSVLPSIELTFTIFGAAISLSLIHISEPTRPY